MSLVHLYINWTNIKWNISPIKTQLNMIYMDLMPSITWPHCSLHLIFIGLNYKWDVPLKATHYSPCCYPPHPTNSPRAFLARSCDLGRPYVWAGLILAHSFLPRRNVDAINNLTSLIFASSYPTNAVYSLMRWPPREPSRGFHHQQKWMKTAHCEMWEHEHVNRKK